MNILQINEHCRIIMNWEKRGKSDYYYRKYWIEDQAFYEYIGICQIPGYVENMPIFKPPIRFPKSHLPYLELVAGITT